MRRICLCVECRSSIVVVNVKKWKVLVACGVLWCLVVVGSKESECVETRRGRMYGVLIKEVLIEEVLMKEVNECMLILLR